MKRFILMFSATAILIVLLAPYEAPGQPVLPDPPEQAPVDGGLWILGASGAASGIRKLRNGTKTK